MTEDHRSDWVRLLAENIDAMTMDYAIKTGQMEALPTTPPIALADMERAFRAAMDAPLLRDRYVIGSGRWHRIMEFASPELRADLEGLVANGTVTVTSILPDPDTAYRVRLPAPVAPDWNPSWGAA